MLRSTANMGTENIFAKRIHLFLNIWTLDIKINKVYDIIGVTQNSLYGGNAHET